MSQINKVYKNFYTDSEYQDFINYVNNIAHGSKFFFQEQQLGRFYGVIENKYMTSDIIGSFPNHLKEKARSFAQDVFGIKELHVYDIILIRYTSENGVTPNLPMHTDNGNLIKYTLDFQCQSNIDWPLIIEGQRFDMKDNDMIAFNGSKQYHGRDDRIFKDSDFLENVFFQFVEKRK
jgi:hypothetical protein